MSVRQCLCLVTVRMKVLQNGRLLRFLKSTNCCCEFSWSICNQNGHFIRCIQGSSFQGYDGIHKYVFLFLNWCRYHNTMWIILWFILLIFFWWRIDLGRAHSKLTKHKPIFFLRHICNNSASFVRHFCNLFVLSSTLPQSRCRSVKIRRFLLCCKFHYL